MQIGFFDHFDQKLISCSSLIQNRHFWQCWPRIGTFDIIGQRSTFSYKTIFSTILTKNGIFFLFYPLTDIFDHFHPLSTASMILLQSDILIHIQHCRKCLPKMKILDYFSQNRHFNQFWSKPNLFSQHNQQSVC